MEAFAMPARLKVRKKRYLKTDTSSNYKWPYGKL